MLRKIVIGAVLFSLILIGVAFAGVTSTLASAPISSYPSCCQYADPSESTVSGCCQPTVPSESTVPSCCR